LQVRSAGQVALMMAECSSEGQLRGIARYADTPTSDQFTELLRDGTLVITIDSRNGEPYQGIVSLEGTSLAQCLEAYFRQSEQLGSLFTFASDHEGVAAMLLQQLPAQRQPDAEERSQSWEHATTLARTLTVEELLQLPNADILLRLYHEEELRVFPTRELAFGCSCNRERTARAISALGREEIESLIAERGEIGRASCRERVENSVGAGC